METADQDNLVDLWQGKIKILKVTHTDKETFLKIKVPVWSTLITDSGKVVKKKEIKNRLMSEHVTLTSSARIVL